MRAIQIVPKNLQELNRFCEMRGLLLEVNPHQIRLGEETSRAAGWLVDTGEGNTMGDVCLMENLAAEKRMEKGWMGITPDPDGWHRFTPEVGRGQSGLKDSGARTQYAGGGIRETPKDRPRPELITPFGLERLAMHYTNGAKKYSDRNWEKGMPFSHYTASMFRHLLAWMAGDDTEDHLAAIAWNALSIMHHQELKEDKWNDMPKYNLEETTD